MTARFSTSINDRLGRTIGSYDIGISDSQICSLRPQFLFSPFCRLREVVFYRIFSVAFCFLEISSILPGAECG
jgi:hypothetical protein